MEKSRTQNMEFSGTDRLLFLKYALACSDSKIRRKEMPEEVAVRVIGLISKNEVPAEPVEGYFKIAMGMCKMIAKRMGKSEIDAGVIRQYFLIEHPKVVDEQCKLNLVDPPDPIRCKARVGTVIKTDGDLAVVETPTGKETDKTVFAKDVKEKDKVIVHLDFIVEKMSPEVEAALAAKSVLS
jgi:hypothetical protein